MTVANAALKNVGKHGSHIKLVEDPSKHVTPQANMPGFKQQGDMTWNFHWAGVVLKDGVDNITLENFAVTEETAKEVGVPQGKYIDRDWNFEATSMAVRTDK